MFCAKILRLLGNFYFLNIESIKCCEMKFCELFLYFKGEAPKQLKCFPYSNLFKRPPTFFFLTSCLLKGAGAILGSRVSSQDKMKWEFNYIPPNLMHKPIINDKNFVLNYTVGLYKRSNRIIEKSLIHCIFSVSSSRHLVKGFNSLNCN